MLAELGANIETPMNGGHTPVYAAAQFGHAYVVTLLAELGANIETADNDGTTPLEISADGGPLNLKSTQALLLLGAPINVRDLRQLTNARSNTRQLRADLQAWAVDALTQHRTFHDTFLFGCSAHEGIALAALGGVDEVREEIGAFVGVVVGAELRRLRAVGPAIAAVDWAAHDEEWREEEEVEGWIYPGDD